ncbi:hypothetical protein N0V88_002228 [Collariella sp. IMI 366227]|nr:hypothetical protein N0V88_002228 [Collariella sp. IMI 366227]
MPTRQDMQAGIYNPGPVILHRPVDERALLPAQARSTEEYPLTEAEEDKDAIIRVATFHRKEYDIALITIGAWSSSKIRLLFRDTFPSTPAASLGSLDRELPTEMLCAVIRYLDLSSMLRFRQVNRRARQLATAMPEYQVVTKYAMDALLALHKTLLAADFTLTDIRTALTTENCRFCGEFGGFVSLLGFQRCCFPCLQLAPELTVYLARNRNTKRLRDALVLRSLPGRYGLVETLVTKRSWLTATKPSNASRPSNYDRMLTGMALPHVDFGPREPRVEPGVCCNGCQVSIEKDELMRGDVEGYGIRQLRDRAYSREGYLGHFRWCREAQALWKASHGGTVPVRIPDEATWGRRLGFQRDNDLDSDDE